MPKVTEEHIEARRRQILGAAIKCFAEQGFHRATMQDIFRESGLSPGAVYGYFSGKEEILRALGQAAFEQAKVDLGIADGEGNPPATLEEAMSRILSLLEHLDVSQLEYRTKMPVQLWAEALRDPQLMALVHEVVGTVIQRLEALVREAQARGELDPDLNPEAVARNAVALFHGLLLQRAWYPEMDIAAYRESALALISGRATASSRP